MEYKSVIILLSITVFGILETVFPFFAYKRRVKIFANNFILGLINYALVNLTIIWLLRWIWQQQSWLGYLGYLKTSYLNNLNFSWLTLILSFLVLDLYMYAWHRLVHSWKFGWRFHLVHHSEMWMNISTAYRFHPLEVIISNLPKFTLIYLLGISPLDLLFYELVFAISLVFHHSNLALPLKLDQFLSYFLVTPNYHRAHHSQTRKVANNNYASILTIWDLIFKSRYYPELPEKIKLGLAKSNQELLLMDLIKIPFWHQKINS
ncbi:MAG: sterol desaturase family protein [Sphaerospermopsis sp. SIO1G1]|nr:sterol desaturase family protein [Sphaerospermopsis sp. SIO1G1]